MIYFDATCACRSAQSTGMPKMARRIFAELQRRGEVHPIFWNNLANCYQELGRREHRLLAQAFAPGHRPAARPEWYGENPLINFWRWLTRRRFPLEAMTAGDVFFVPDIYRDGRRPRLAEFLKDAAVRAVAIFHDAADLHLPALHPDAGEKVRGYIESLALFDCVICVSEESRQDLLDLWKKHGSAATETTVEGWAADVSSAAQAAIGPSEPIILFVSSFTPRKNHLLLLQAAEKLWDRGVRFELHLLGRSAGSGRNRVVAAVGRLRRSGRSLFWHRHVNDEKLEEAYRRCRFTVYPSLKEGFGLPIMESLLHGKPCLCGGNGALGEIARGGGCLMVDQTKSDTLAAGMERLLMDSALYAALTTEARARKFRSWPDYLDHLEGHLSPA
jgi:glycosyltransferase involved in cell wall biosynthesis